ncbi:MAG: type II toxin-antitoxin system HicB family antitoxin [Magnetococcus sp. DMHC-1]|nr:type II toxin-antitoxin system HicB family antitoxin [Magnetococcales bacterium]
MERRFPVVLDPQEPKVFFARFPDLEECFTEGETEEEALFNAAEVLTAMLEWRMDNGQPLPEPSRSVSGAHFILLDARMQAAMDEYERMHAAVRDVQDGFAVSYSS